MPLGVYISMIKVLYLGSFSLSSGITQKVHLHLSTSIKFLGLLSGCQLSSEARHTPPWLGAQRFHAMVTADRVFIRLGGSSGFFFMCLQDTQTHLPMEFLEKVFNVPVSMQI